MSQNVRQLALPGKHNPPRSIRSRATAQASIIALFLTACAPTVTPDARYAGSVTPATPGEFCQPGRATLRLLGNEALFTPSETTWSLNGNTDANGTFQAERIASGVSKQPYPTRLTGTWTAKAATGTYTTPRCTYTVQLTRQ